MTKFILTLLDGLTTASTGQANPAITQLSRAGDLAVTNTMPGGVLTVEEAPVLQGPWRAKKSVS